MRKKITRRNYRKNCKKRGGSRDKTRKKIKYQARIQRANNSSFKELFAYILYIIEMFGYETNEKLDNDVETPLNNVIHIMRKRDQNFDINNATPSQELDIIKNALKEFNANTYNIRTAKTLEAPTEEN